MADRVVINGLVVDRDGEALRDAAGERIELRPQTFAVLRYLAEHPGRLVTKDELMQAVWPGIAVTDDSLVQCIHEIRRALGDGAHAVLKTLPRRGYILELKPEIPPPPPSATTAARSSRIWMLPAVGIVIALSAAGWFAAGSWLPTGGPPTLAVLPFDNIGGDPGQAYFADGIGRDLTTDLARVPGLAVAPQDSAWAYRDRPADIRTIARELGVRYVLDGSVQWQGADVRVNAQLIDTDAGTNLWAERYDGPMEDIFAFHFQDKVITRIVTALAVELTEGTAVPAAQAASADTAAAVPGLLSGDDLVVEAKIPKSVTWLGYGFDAAWTTLGTNLFRVNAADNSFVEIKLDASGDFRPVGTGEGAVWLPDIRKRKIIKVDPETNSVVLEIPAEMLFHQSTLGAGFGSIWVVTAKGGSDRMLTRFNAATGAVEAEIPLPSVGADVLVDFGSVWVAGVDGNAVYRIDPQTNAITTTIAVHSRPKKLCAVEGSVWVLNSTDGYVDRIDGRTGQITASIDAGLVFPLDGDMACGGGYVWGHVAAFHAGEKAIPSLPLVQIDPRTNEVIRRYIGGKGIGWDLRYGGGSLWMTGAALFRIAPPA